MLIVLLEYIDLFQSEWQHETNIWEGYPAIYHSILLHFILSIGIITNYKHILLKFAPIMPAFCLPIITINLPAASLDIEALKIACPWMLQLFSR